MRQGLGKQHLTKEALDLRHTWPIIRARLAVVFALSKGPAQESGIGIAMAFGADRRSSVSVWRDGISKQAAGQMQHLTETSEEDSRFLSRLGFRPNFFVILLSR